MYLVGYLIKLGSTDLIKNIFFRAKIIINSWFGYTDYPGYIIQTDGGVASFPE